MFNKEGEGKPLKTFESRVSYGQNEWQDRLTSEN